MNFKQIQQHELNSWISKDEKQNRDKKIRETIRYPLLKKQMGLDYLDTSEMSVLDLGAGPFNGVSSILRTKHTLRSDPLAEEYRKHYPLYSYIDMRAEMFKESLGGWDLIIVTNAIDHFLDPEEFLQHLCHYMKPGAFFAHIHAINNAYSHPHKAHYYNVNPEMFHHYLDNDFETCWYQDFQQDGLTYGWRKQPAFSGLYRKVTGYNDSR